MGNELDLNKYIKMFASMRHGCQMLHFKDNSNYIVKTYIWSH